MHPPDTPRDISELPGNPRRYLYFSLLPYSHRASSGIFGTCRACSLHLATFRRSSQRPLYFSKLAASYRNFSELTGPARDAPPHTHHREKNILRVTSRQGCRIRGSNISQGPIQELLITVISGFPGGLSGGLQEGRQEGVRAQTLLRILK